MERLRSQVHRRRFCVARGALRLLLARYLGCAAAALEFDYGEHGKPSVASSNPNPSDLRFNLSHSEGEAMLAVARGIDVGVDIQQVAAQVDCVGIARRYFSNAEVQRLLNLSPAAQSEAFFECWTRKESYLKACGGGLQLPLSDFEVAFGPDTAAGLLRVGWDASEVQRWEMVDLATAEGFRGALTMERCGRTRRYFEAESVLVNHPAAGFSQ